MNTYTISLFREIHYKLEVPAESLSQAIASVEANGLIAGKLTTSAMTESQELDDEGIYLDNASQYPSEVATLTGLTVEQVAVHYGAGSQPAS